MFITLNIIASLPYNFEDIRVNFIVFIALRKCDFFGDLLPFKTISFFATLTYDFVVETEKNDRKKSYKYS